MINKYIGLCSITISSIAFAGEMASSAPPVNNGVFLGIGGSYNSVSLQKQKIWGKGVTDAYTGPILTSTGSASGYSNPFYQNESRFAPQAQIGYLQHFTGNNYFWGVKFVYNYLDAHFSNNNMTIAQAGSNYNLLTDATTSFTGNYAVESVQTAINHELLLLGFLGQSFNKSNVYLGIGPSLVEMQNNIYHLIGYADYQGNQGTNISGAPAYLSKSFWEWGGSAQLGVTYALSPSWFLDFNYTYTRIFRDTIKYISPFTNHVNADNLVGTSFINPSQQAVTQGFSVTINKQFEV